MRKQKSVRVERVATFGLRKVAPRVCVADSKKHIRTFLGEALEELGFITSECAAATELSSILKEQLPDLIVVGLPADGVEAGLMLKMMVDHEYSGRVLLIGPKNSILVTALHQLGEEFGVAMLPPLATPFSA